MTKRVLLILTYFCGVIALLEFIALMTYRLKHPDLTETQLMINIWWQQAILILTSITTGVLIKKISQ
jgi:hypothetical protein